MAKERKTQISVTTVFDGKQDGRQVFIDLILMKHRANSKLDSDPAAKYNNSKVFSDVRSERKERMI